MIRTLLIFSLAACAGQTLYAQKSRDFSKSRRDVFGGARDYRDITNNALQISFGPNFTFTRSGVTEYPGQDANTRPTTTFVDPSGRVGAFIDIGMAHYRMKPSAILLNRQKRRKEKGKEGRDLIGANLIHRIDWGIGFDYIGGAEHTKVDFTDALGNYAYSQEEKGGFYNGYLTARVTADRFTRLNDKWHLETGLGVNFNYNILSSEPEGYHPSSAAPLVFQKDFMAQIHGHLGFNYKIRRGDYFVMGLYLPAIGVYEWNKAKPTIQWYSSNYWPVHLQFKWIHHFTKKSNGCNTGTPEDRKRNEQFLQGN